MMKPLPFSLSSITRHPLIVLASVVVLWLAVGLIVPSGIAVSLCQEKAGQWGDQFGAINSLFSGLALAGLILTILHQREDHKSEVADRKQAAVDTKEELELRKLLVCLQANEAVIRTVNANINELRELGHVIRRETEMDFAQQRADAYIEIRKCLARLRRLYPIEPVMPPPLNQPFAQS